MTKFNSFAIISLLIFFLGGEVALCAPIELDDSTPSHMFLRKIQEIGVNGDIANEDYYQRQIGVSLAGDGPKWVNDPTTCGPAYVSRIERKYERRLYYKSSPYFFDHRFGGDSRCGFPYSKEYLPNDEIVTSSLLIIDDAKMCIKERDVQEFFDAAEFSFIKGRFFAKYVNLDNKKTSIEFISTPTDGCVVQISLHQTKHEGWLK